jgi:hypothetical protein
MAPLFPRHAYRTETVVIGGAITIIGTAPGERSAREHARSRGRFRRVHQVRYRELAEVGAAQSRRTVGPKNSEGVGEMVEDLGPARLLLAW